jgi:copper chaperone CopZ
MKTLSLMAIAILLLFTNASAQIKNSVTDTVKIYGNCGMCKAKIEKAVNQKNISQAEWNEETGIAVITFDAAKTSKDLILKRISLVGYDSDLFKAPDAVYNKLPGCCRYDRPKKN